MLTSILRTTNSLIAKELIFANSINKVDRGKMIEENSGTESETRFFIPGVKLAFSTTLILHHFDTKYHIWIETDASGYAIGRILRQLT